MARKKYSEVEKEIMKSVSRNLKSLLFKKGISQKEVAERSELATSTISDYVNAKTLISPGNLQKIADALNEPKSAIDSSMSKTEYATLSSAPIPLYGNIAAGALAMVDGVTKENLEYLNVPKKLLGKHANNKGLFAMKVNGDSMNKAIPNGSYVVGKPIEHSEMKDNDIVIFSHDGDYSMKRVWRDEEDRVLVFNPESDNKKFRDVVIPFDTINDLKIYAKVIWYSVILD